MSLANYQPVFYSSTDRSGGAKRLAVAAMMRVMRAANQGRVMRTTMPDSLSFPPSSTKRFTKGASHYGIMIPDLPEPHRFLANMIIIGGTGFKAWDDDAALEKGPRGVCQLGWGSAVTEQNSFHVFNPDDVLLADDGSSLEFGDSYTLSINYPEIRVRGRLGGLSVELTLTSTDVISWVADSGIYRHFSFLCHYEGSIAVDGEAPQQVSGMGTFEYGTGYLPYMDLTRPLPRPLKIPADFFTYHVLDLGDETQLAACVVGAFGKLTAAVGADVRHPTRGSRRLGSEAEFRVLEFDETVADYRGRAHMRLPRSFQWNFRGSSGTSTLIGRVDTRWLYAGMGYIAGYSWEGVIEGEARSGRGYLEYSDRR